MNHTSAILTLLSFILPLQGLFAQDRKDEGMPMTLRDCLLYAREHAHANRLSRLES